MRAPAPQYLFDPADKPRLPHHRVPVIVADEASISGYGHLVDDPDRCEIEIVPWPQTGSRPIDEGTGNEGGIAEGVFHGAWQGDVLIGRNAAVDGHYVLGFATDPDVAASDKPSVARDKVLLWHMNYHPDGGQMFFPLDKAPFLVPLALPGDDITPERVVAFWFDGSRGLYIHPGIWHEGIFPTADSQRFADRQGKVHARVSCDFGEEFGCYLAVALTPPAGPA